MSGRPERDREPRGPQQRRRKVSWRLRTFVAALLMLAAVIAAGYSLYEASKPRGPQKGGNNSAAGQNGPLAR